MKRYILFPPVLLLCFAMACNPAKKVQKYDYLTDKSNNSNHQSESSVEKPKPKVDSKPVEKPKKDKPVKNDEIQTVINTAESYMGVPYQYGGMSRSGMDCSGLVCLSYQSIGQNLPHNSGMLSELGSEINRKKLKPGDLVFFDSTNKGRINHVGIVTEVDGSSVSFIHATTSRGVRVDELNSGYWEDKFRKAVRP